MLLGVELHGRWFSPPPHTTIRIGGIPSDRLTQYALVLDKMMLRQALRASVAVLPAQRRVAAALFQRSFASYPAHEVVGLPGEPPLVSV